MALVAGNQQAAFTDPQNGQSPIDADQVTDNDNALRVNFNTHDADGSLHVQSGLLSAIPTADATNIGGVYVSTDGLRAYVSDGAGTWNEVAYFLAAGGTISGATTFGSTIAVTGAATFNGAVTLGDAAGDNITFTGRVASHIGFAADATYDVGVSGAKPRDVLVGRNLDVAGTGTFAGLLTTLASSTGGAGLNLPHGTAPTTPVNGDVWTTTAGIYARINGSTVGPLGAGGGGGVSGSGTAAKVAIWTGTSSIGDSIITDSGTAVSVGGDFSVTGDITGTATFAGLVQTAASVVGTAGLNLPHGTAPTTPVDGDVWTTTAGMYVRINGSTVGPLGAAGGGGVTGSGTSGKLTKWTGTSSVGDSVITESATTLTSTLPLYLPASTTSVPSLRLPHGSAPTSPTNGDVWTTTAGMYARINGSTVGPFGTGGSGAPTDATYVTLTTNGTLTNERVLTAGTGIGIADGGAGSTVTISVTGSYTTGSLSSGYIPKATGTTSLANSLVQDNGTTVTVGGALAVTGAATLNGNVTLGDAITDTITFTGYVASTVKFATDNTYDIGANGATRPKDYYGAGNGTFGGNLVVGGTGAFTGKLTTAASGSGAAGINIPHGTAPSAPSNGDFWTTTAGSYQRINSATYTMASVTISTSDASGTPATGHIWFKY